MYKDRLEMACRYLQWQLKLKCPKDTGNLAKDFIRLEQVDKYTWQIVIGGELAPYAIFTNEPWVASRWNGKQNPNEGWVERTIKESLPTLRQMLEGAITTSEVENMITANKNIFNKQLASLVGRKTQ